MNIIVGVMTSRSYTERRRACEQTWFCRLKRQPNIRPLFLVGDDVGAGEVTADTLRLPCDDNYCALPYKTREFCRWAMGQDFDYVFKCDDDTFICVARFLSFQPNGLDYIGVDPVDHINPKFASGGAGYWLSRKAVAIVANMDVRAIQEATGGPPAEDLIVYHALTMHGVRFAQDKRFQAWNQPHRQPRAANEVITCHYINPSEMRRLDAFTQELDASSGYAGLDRGSNTRFSGLLSQHFQVDWMGLIGKSARPLLLQESISVMGDWAHREALRLQIRAFTYLQELDGYAQFLFHAPTYDFDYIKLVKARDPLNRNPRAVYVFGRKTFGFPNGVLFNRATYQCNYAFRYTLAGMTSTIDSNIACGPLVADKLHLQNQYKFAIACENMIATGYITEKLLDCFVSDTVPIYIGGQLPHWLESCVCRVSATEDAEAQIRAHLAMSDAHYLELMAKINDLRFSHELFDFFAYQSLFDKAGIGVQAHDFRIDGTKR